MRIQSIILGAMAVCALNACTKLSLEPLSFDVTVDNVSVTPGQNVNFTFSGKPDNISFYSGEFGRRFDLKDRVTADGTPKFQFSSAMNSGTQANTLKLLVSTNFAGGANGVLDSAAIATADWTDISTRATWASNATATSSGAIDLSDFAATSKPVYIAFKYKALAGAIQNKWTLSALSLRNTLADGTSYILDTIPSVVTAANYGVNTVVPGWSAKTMKNTFSWDLKTLVIAGATTAAAATDSTVAWMITGPLNLKKVTPDAAVALQNMNDWKPNYSYTYNTPGTYKAVFVASNANASKTATTVKTVTITVK